MKRTRQAMTCAGVILAFILTGCSEPVAEVTQQQVDAWQQQARETIPGATEVSIETDVRACAAGPCGYLLNIWASFPTYEDLASGEEALYALVQEVERTVDEKYDVKAYATANDGDALDLTLAEMLASEVDDIAGAWALTFAFDASQPPPWETSAQVRLFVDPSPDLGTQHLEQVVTLANEALEARGASVANVRYFAADQQHGDRLSTFEIENPVISINDFLPASQAVGDEECFRAGDMVFYLSGNIVYTRPADTPVGECS